MQAKLLPLRPAPAFAVSLLLALSLTSVGCGGGSGSGSGSTGSVGAGSGQPNATGQVSTVNQAHWQTALAALGQSYQPQPPAFDDAALRQWSAILAQAWPALQDVFGPPLEAQLQQSLAGLNGGGVVVTQVRSSTLDLSTPPMFSSGAADEIVLTLPAAPGAWRVEAVLDLIASAQPTVFGFSVPVSVSADATLAVEDIRVTVPVRFDLSNPGRPQPVSAGTPRVDLRLVVSSNTPVLQGLAGLIAQLVDPVVRAVLSVGATYLQQQLTGVLQQAPTTPWGLGGPGTAALAAPPDLDALAQTISQDIQANHTPFGTVVSTEFSQPGYGNGVPVSFGGYGDSAIWTGHYLMAEALRFDTTGDPAALAAATKVFDGLNKCLDVSRADGQLSRCVVPVTSPHLASIQNGLDFHVGQAGGQSYGAEGDISRDQYLGAFMGFVQTHLRIPSLRPRAAGLISRMVDYLERNDWIARKVDGVTPARGLFAVTPHVTWAAIKAANLADRARWQTLHDQNTDLAKICWFTMWTSNLEVMVSYYKFNLQHDTLTILVSTETDPALYREYLKAVEITRDGTGHHMNAWFDSVYGMAVPAVSAQIGPQVEAELEHWALRDRRTHPVDLTNDPTVPKATYTSSLMGTSPLNSAITTGQTSTVFAAEPIPIEKRPFSDFLWQRNPFQLTGGGRPTNEQPGVDLVLPYWVGKSYGLFN